MRILAIIGLLCATPLYAQRPNDAVDTYVRSEMRARNIPGLTLAVVAGGRIQRIAGYGVANLELGVPATDSTVYLIASITKPITAVAVMSLVEQGRLSLEDTIASHLEELPSAWRRVTIRQLLNHTSGINSLTEHDRPPCGTTKSERYYVPADVLAEVACLPLDFEPGTSWSYSDTGYYLLGLIIERVSGMAYEQYLREHLFQPYGITGTRLLTATELVPNRADNYIYKDGRYVNGPLLHAVVEFSFGGLIATAGDLARFDIALNAGRIVQKRTLDEMWMPTPIGDAAYGLGFALRPIDGHRQAGHTGGGPAASTIYSRFLDDDLTVIVLTNAAQPPFSMRDLAAGIARLYRH